MATTAVWIDETLAPLEPRNIYGVTKLAAEQVCRLVHAEHGLPVIVLRTGRFFPEDDDTHDTLSGENMKANELLHRRLTVEDAAEAHLVALERAPSIGFGTFILSAPTPFGPGDAAELKADAPAVIARLLPRRGRACTSGGDGRCPGPSTASTTSRLAEDILGFRCRTAFADVLEALRQGAPLPFAHDPGYTSPKEAGASR